MRCQGEQYSYAAPFRCELTASQHHPSNQWVCTDRWGHCSCLLLATYKNETCLCGIKHSDRVKTHLFKCLQHLEASAKDRLKKKIQRHKLILGFLPSLQQADLALLLRNQRKVCKYYADFQNSSRLSFLN